MLAAPAAAQTMDIQKCDLQIKLDELLGEKQAQGGSFARAGGALGDDASSREVEQISRQFGARAPGGGACHSGVTV